ncbi:hypothetical protein ASPVEDRAFT_310614 [Aspergillus versicolor CBS 583.65]|uniref:Uncharacterized protein n=1 Tax=Aspergillus versicolor CBS 583.65 TaxID=1036611 RepID=A0A1L9PWY7_ASPVE|nr:uncharacterized protein ASPVEDRAFT_310614 [Aspergillus versicolor CBS 583.65]OJJ06060.1 hypothetical protein ASPVEDRAFT_310614 [Aspergillus versicolor CBS 583.65]
MPMPIPCDALRCHANLREDTRPCPRSWLQLHLWCELSSGLAVLDVGCTDSEALYFLMCIVGAQWLHVLAAFAFPSSKFSSACGGCCSRSVAIPDHLPSC